MTAMDRPQKNAKAPLKRLFMILLAAGVIAGSVVYQRRGGTSDDPNQPLFPVLRGPLTISVTESGTIKPRELEIIKNELEGNTTILFLIPEGTRVAQGELLVELDASQLQEQKIDQEIKVQNTEAAFIQSRENVEVVKNQAQSDVDKAKLTLLFAGEDLQQYSAGVYPNELRESEAQIKLAEEEERRAEEKLKWSRILFDEKYLSESELQADDLALKKAELDVELAENRLSLLKEFTYKRTVTELESDVKQAEMAMERVTRKASADVVQAEADFRAKELEFKRQTDKLEKIAEQIGKARILAPREGLVVYATSTRASWHGNNEPLDEGQQVREREELIHLPTASTFLAEITVHESNLDRIKIGLPVRITVDALPGKEFKGTVAKIAPLPDARSMFMNPDLKLFNTEVHIDGGGDLLRTGMSCKAEVLIDRYDSALQVPVQSVIRVSGKPTVFVHTASGREERPVEIGLDNNRMVRILSGIEEGDEVLLAPPLDVASDAERTEDVVESSRPDGPKAGVAAGQQGSRPPAGAGGRPDRAGQTDEQRKKMREQYEKLSPEEREAMKQRRQQRGGTPGAPSGGKDG